MKIQLLGVLAALCLAAGISDAGAGEKPVRQKYPLDTQKNKANAIAVENDLKKFPEDQQESSVVWYAVNPLSSVQRLPDSYPADGEIFGALNYIAAQGEFEPASFVVYPKKNVDKLTFKVSDFSQNNLVIPAGQMDLKLVKIWYQQGSAWYSFFSDNLTSVLCPELLVNDENLIYADTVTKDNYVRYDNADGTRRYFWNSANFMLTDYSMDAQVCTAMLADADTLQPVVLNKHEWKQFFCTFHVPRDTAPGLYSGSITVLADGEEVGSIPVNIRVLPFELPLPKTNYDLNKEFYLSFYGAVTDNPKVVKNLADHNARHPYGYPVIDPLNPDRMKLCAELAQKTGMGIRPAFAAGPGAGIAKDLDEQREKIKKYSKASMAVYGHSDIYNYAIDEGSIWTVRAERPTWLVTRDAGQKILATTHPKQQQLYTLDYMNMPGIPEPARAKEVAKFHESNPNAIVSWYANPHTGPENPDYMRRAHGYTAYKFNYDASANYVWYRYNWNDWACPHESNLRGLMMVYATRNNVLDTLAWEGIREGMDDIRYATKLKEVANKALESESGKIHFAGREALSFLAYADEQRQDINAFRMECINYILELTELMKGENVK